jgi:hypothetical protein
MRIVLPAYHLYYARRQQKFQVNWPGFPYVTACGAGAPLVVSHFVAHIKETGAFVGALISKVLRVEVGERRRPMVNKEKLLLLATIYMLVPGAMPADALAENNNGEGQKAKNKRSGMHRIAADSDKTDNGKRRACD